MSLEVKGRITHILEPQTGTSAKGEWIKQEFILETDGEYPKSVCIESWNNKIDAGLLKVGNVLNVSINVESREYNGRWYSTIKAWKAEVISGGKAGSNYPQNASGGNGEEIPNRGQRNPPAVSEGEETDNFLPF